MAFETRLLFAVGAWTPWLVEKTLDYMLGAVARDVDHPERIERFLEKTFDSRPSADLKTWKENKADVRTILIEDSRQAFRNGSRGAA